MFEILVKRASELFSDEDSQLDEVSNLAFADSISEDLCWSNSEWFLLGKLDGLIVSIVGILSREIHVGSEVVLVGGIGGVATHPRFQRQGYAGKLMERAGHFMRYELKVPFGLLVCEPKRMHFYKTFGWEPMSAPMFFECNGDRRRYEGPVMILRLSDNLWPEGEVDLLGGPW